MITNTNQINARLQQAVLQDKYDIAEYCLNNGGDPNHCDDNGYPLLFLAAQVGNVLMTKLLLQKGAKKNQLSPEGYSSVYVATSYNRFLVLTELINNKADCNLTQQENASPLYRAAAIGHVNCLKILIGGGAHVNTMLNGISAVYIASSNNLASCLETLIENGADCNITGPDQATPLHRACFAGHYSCVDLLINKGGADVNTEYKGASAVVITVQQKNMPCLKMLIQAKANLESDKVERSPLMAAMSMDHYKYAQELLKGGAKVDGNFVVKVPLENGQELEISNETTPLINAVHFGLKYVILLLNSNAKIDLTDKSVGSAIHYAAGQGESEVLKELISRKANINLVSVWGYTPIQLAKKTNQHECVEILRNAGAKEDDDYRLVQITAMFEAIEKADLETLCPLLKNKDILNVINEQGHTPIIAAIKNENADCLKELIKAGADKNKKSLSEMSPVYYCVIMKQLECLQILIDEKADLNSCCNNISPCYIAAQLNEHESLSKLIKAGANFELAEANGATPLYKASSEGSNECVKVLISNGAKVDVEVNGYTPVYLASEKGFTNILEMLLKANAPVECKNLKNSPLFRSAALGKHESVKLLIQFGANLESEFDGMTPLWRAAYNGHEKCGEYLLEAGANKNHVDHNGYGVLYAAQTRGHDKFCELIKSYAGSDEYIVFIEKGNVVMRVTPQQTRLNNQELGSRFVTNIGSDVKKQDDQNKG
ncbi:MAG: ankyrin repeat domain-containing protein [Parachlamydiaceae bacterium]|nr:ankyrin repeat domain-containing protein [Parachlamydiaceae bacterium]